ncbi:MAG: UPF0182 family protein [Dehalococcoidales bacterium]|nr:MAG: UPF0182 family protein [Dehalococcoidales bacterium]
MDSLERLWERSAPREPGPKRPRLSRRGWGFYVLIIAGAIFVLFILLNIAKGFYTDWLWFKDLGYSSVYTTILGTRVAVFFVAVATFASLFLGNLILAMRLSPKGLSDTLPVSIVARLRRFSWWSVIGGTIFLSLIFGYVAQNNWLEVLQYFNGQPFGINDPVFNKEVSFYVFSLPFLRFLHGWFLWALILTILSSAGIYATGYIVQRARFDFSRLVLTHIGGLAIAILGLFAWGYRLSISELVYSKQGVVFGAGYADMHAKLPAQWIMLAVVIICAGLFGVTIIRRRLRWAVYGIAGWVGAAIIIGIIFPFIVQRFQVEPNELVREAPYIEYNIEFTREAFALNRIDEQSFPAEEMPSIEEIDENQATINNIRLWDHRPLLETYQQLQSIRLYYDFNDVDVDRYPIDGEYRQVMLSAREISAENLASEAQTWVNRRLQYTHGYGIAMSPVNEVSTEGLPNFFVKDLPPVGVVDITRPGIYFGEKTNDYVIVNAKTDEIDYRAGDDTIYSRYQGETGVSLSGFIRRLVYAWEMGDFNILISSELTPESRILYHRNIQDRVNHIAPFLKLDSDPYLVVMEDGRLVWIQDAYTVTDRYPYSEPLSNGLNYIRNSVKVVIDAYDGSTIFYIADTEDALIRTYQAIFPELFVDAEEMPEDLKAHRRYPEYMFDVQAEVYQTYHMQNAAIFYNKEDLWAVPREYYDDREQLMEPYYVTMRLPGEDEDEFLLMLPFTPTTKEFTIGWLAARCDGNNYGKLFAYNFPKTRQIYGPSQIENRIQQDTEITKELALWGQGGSKVIRGNLLLIPLGNSHLYVEPVFLEAEGVGLPELKRVIVAAGDQIAMENTLEESIAAIYGMLTPEEPPTGEPDGEEPPTPTEPVSAEIVALIDEAWQHYNQAQEFYRAGDWVSYGQEMEAFENTLDQLMELIDEE